MLLLSSAVLAGDAATTATYFAALAEPAGWVEVSRKEAKGVGEIVIRHKEIAGQDCLEGLAFAALPPDALLDAARDIVSQPSWSSWTLPASVVLSPGTERFDYYQVLDNPQPVADRYWFLHATVSRVGEQRIFTWELVDPETRYPAALASVRERFPDAVPTRVNVGDWTFTPEAGRTRIRYRICTDAGGSIPRWVGEMAATRTLPTNLADIVREVRRRVGR